MTRELVLALALATLPACGDGSSRSDGTAGGCTGQPVCEGHTCCGTKCVNLQNDILNCGTCGNACPADKPYCDRGTCSSPPCSAGVTCSAGRCCKETCCAPGKICCSVPGPVGPSPTSCTDPVNGTCPMGCVLCACLSASTEVATPSGPMPVALIREGDLVYSIDDAAIRAVPVLRTRRTPVSQHWMVRVVLAARSLEASALHPTADGRTFGELRAGDALDGVPVQGVSLVPYPFEHTHDLLPDSDTGTYFVAGVAVGSTLFQRRPLARRSGTPRAH